MYSTDKQSPFQKGMNPIDIAGMGGQRYKDFITATTAPAPQAYSDAMRLRDENRNFDTRLLEYKNQQQEQKLLLEDQQKRQQELQQIVNQGIPVVQSLVARIANKGYVDDDNVDVSQTMGSEDFITQREQPLSVSRGDEPGFTEPPPAMELMPPQQLLKGSSEGEWEDIAKKQRKPYNTLKRQLEQKKKEYPNVSEDVLIKLIKEEKKPVPKQKGRPKKDIIPSVSAQTMEEKESLPLETKSILKINKSSKMKPKKAKRIFEGDMNINEEKSRWNPIETRNNPYI